MAVLLDGVVLLLDLESLEGQALAGAKVAVCVVHCT